MRLWRWLCCRTGHHRETVDVYACGWVEERTYAQLRCLDCGSDRLLYTGMVVTPSRRYALRRTP